MASSILVRFAGPCSAAASGLTTTTNNGLAAGARIEARFGGGREYYYGLIDADNGDGTFSVRYEDGDAESSVAAGLIRRATATTEQAEDDDDHSGGDGDDGDDDGNDGAVASPTKKKNKPHSSNETARFKTKGAHGKLAVAPDDADQLTQRAYVELSKWDGELADTSDAHLWVNVRDLDRSLRRAIHDINSEYFLQCNAAEVAASACRPTGGSVVYSPAANWPASF